MRIFFFLFYLLIIAGCRDNKNENIGKNEVLLPPSDSSTLYFSLKPSWKDQKNNALDTFVNKWYSKMLYALGEPVLRNYKGDKEIYRLTWLRSFDPPISIRIERQNDITNLIVKMSDGAGGYEPGKLITNKTVGVTDEEWNSVLHKITLSDFWKLETDENHRGNDGAEWILEGVSKSNYHVVTKWSPSGQYANTCSYLIELSKLAIPKDRYY